MPIVNFNCIGISRLPPEIVSSRATRGTGRMFRKCFTCGRLLLICLLLPGICPLAPGQSNTAASIDLARIEMSIDQGKLDEVEKPLLDYAIAHPRDVKALELLGRLR